MAGARLAQPRVEGPVAVGTEYDKFAVGGDGGVTLGPWEVGEGREPRVCKRVLDRCLAAVPNEPARSHRDQRQRCDSPPLHSGKALRRRACLLFLADRGVVKLESGIADIPESTPRILLHAMLQQAPQRTRDCSRECAPFWFALKDRRNRVRGRVAPECRATGQHLVEHTAERPDVSPLVDRLSARLLGAHVRRRAEDPSRLRSIDRDCRCRWQVRLKPHTTVVWPANVKLRQAEVEDLYRSVRRDLDVGRLQITMHDAFLVCRVERVRDLPRNGQRLGKRYRSAVKACRQRFARHEFEHEPADARRPLRARRSRRCGGDSGPPADALRARSAPAARDRS